MAGPPECIDCIATGITTWRALHPSSGPRSPRCTTHTREIKRARKAAAHLTYVRRVYRVEPEDYADLWAYQDERCPCGRQPTRHPDTDHDHRLARQHDHPEQEACPECLRGLLCRACNTYVIGRYSSSQLRALADYIDDPPWPRLRARLEQEK